MAIIHFILILLLTFLMVVGYRSNAKLPTMFYIKMAASDNFKRGVYLLILAAICLFNMTYIYINPSDWGGFITIILAVLFFSFKRSTSLFRLLRNNKILMVAVFTVTLILMFVPHGYSLSGTGAFVLLGATFFPSDKLDGKVTYADINLDYPYVSDQFIDAYFS